VANTKTFEKVNPWYWLRKLSQSDIGVFPHDTTAPTDGSSGANVLGPGAVIIYNGVWYFNSGTKASPVWSELQIGPSLLKRATGTISSANITGTAAGQLGHANGVPLVAAPGASVALMPVALGMYYTFNTAAYGAGGNVSLNWGAGGAALTGVVSAANSLGAASSKAVMFFPLSTAGVAIVSNASLNLVAAAAFTNPGTAAGTISWELWYRKLTVGF